MGHLDSQRSLPVIGGDKSGFSAAAKKLRLAAGHKVAVLNAPAGYLARLSPGPADIRTELQGARDFDAVQLFVSTADELRRLGPAAIAAVKDGGLLWITFRGTRPPMGPATCRPPPCGLSATSWARSPR